MVLTGLRRVVVQGCVHRARAFGDWWVLGTGGGCLCDCCGGRLWRGRASAATSAARAKRVGRGMSRPALARHQQVNYSGRGAGRAAPRALARCALLPPTGVVAPTCH
jgi:hypothetical protein